MNQDRRDVRHVVSPRLYVAMNGSSSGGILHDVSDGGLALDVVGPQPADERLQLNFDMTETGEHFEGIGRVIWKSESENRLGLQFVDLPEASRKKVRSWLKAKTISPEALQNVVVQDRGDSTYFETPPWSRDRAGSPTVSGLRESPKKVASPISVAFPAPQNSAVPVSDPTNNLAAQSRSETNVHPGRPSSAERNEYDDPIAADLRSKFSKSSANEPVDEREKNPKRVPFQWKELRPYVLAAAIICLAILILGLAIAISRTSDLNLGINYQAVRSLVVKTFRTGERGVLPAPAPIEQPKENNLHPGKGTRGTGDTAAKYKNAEKSAVPQQFEVMDAQHGRRYFPRTSTNVEVQFVKPRATPATNLVAAGKPRLPQSVIKLFSAPLSYTSAITAGRVSQKSSGELPVVEIIPEYPTLALQTNVQGRVVLNAIIANDGSLHDVRLTSSPSMLDATVLDAVKKWRYQPHYENGEPVEVETQIVVEFSITMQ